MAETGDPGAFLVGDPNAPDIPDAYLDEIMGELNAIEEVALEWTYARSQLGIIHAYEAVGKKVMRLLPKGPTRDALRDVPFPLVWQQLPDAEKREMQIDISKEFEDALRETRDEYLDVVRAVMAETQAIMLASGLYFHPDDLGEMPDHSEESADWLLRSLTEWTTEQFLAPPITAAPSFTPRGPGFFDWSQYDPRILLEEGLHKVGLGFNERPSRGRPEAPWKKYRLGDVKAPVHAFKRVQRANVRSYLWRVLGSATDEMWVGIWGVAGATYPAAAQIASSLPARFARDALRVSAGAIVSPYGNLLQDIIPGIGHLPKSRILSRWIGGSTPATSPWVVSQMRKTINETRVWYRWVHGSPKNPVERHEQANGKEYTDQMRPYILSNVSGWPADPIYPGDHAHCTCREEIVVRHRLRSHLPSTKSKGRILKQFLGYQKEIYFRNHGDPRVSFDKPEAFNRGRPDYYQLQKKAKKGIWDPRMDKILGTYQDVEPINVDQVYRSGKPDLLEVLQSTAGRKSAYTKEEMDKAVNIVEAEFRAAEMEYRNHPASKQIRLLRTQAFRYLLHRVVPRYLEWNLTTKIPGVSYG